MNLVFKILLNVVITFMVVAFTLIGTSVLINNFGTLGFVFAPFLALAVAYGIYLWWKRFCKKTFHNKT